MEYKDLSVWQQMIYDLIECTFKDSLNYDRRGEIMNRFSKELGYGYGSIKKKKNSYNEIIDILGVDLLEYDEDVLEWLNKYRSQLEEIISD